MSGLFFNEYPYTDLHELNLSWVITQVKNITESVKDMDEWIATHQQEYEQLKKLYDQIISGNFPPSIINAFYNWMKNNAYDLIGSMVRTVHFGLTNDGYFCAYIPDNWSFLQFDTISDFSDPLYGHLVLMYD